ncbi:MAG TPA: PilZ domain-containing protein [Candidatus Sulfotelmatobacter sp.]|nr:PilZ domain-containing protein [Candidatus Sulfotelmatobacter sp.]
MGSGTVAMEQRRGSRTKAVLPVRVKGKDSAGKAFDILVHTLDVTPDGVRLGSVRHQLKVLDELTVFYRQRRIQFRVVWTKKLEGTSEYQVGLKAVTHDSEAWGLSFPDYKRQPNSPSAVLSSAGA